MNNKIYLIEGSSGSYSDYESHIVSAYLDKGLANVVCHQMNVDKRKRYRELGELKSKQKLTEKELYEYWELSDKWDYEVIEVDLHGEVSHD